ncbi:MAG TPA: ABC transporter ATP-binding protein [Intrasporangium sp.]|uniref:ABC transporter ATP-binding protein n=1 Tax=Intrasporangium sp. TaxID=1925024 RepID=UPI002D764F93|nr:ABC transporter ATP-binding protein [Intrasporangium sp.]HET7397704.1 ABC transporter ATP-binding protein [Intrasporangium sp.]
MNQALGSRNAGETEILAAENLRKTYGDRVALKGLTFSLKAGRVLGFLGPNGAGKTTSMRILTTILRPSSGHFVVDGISSRHPEAIRRRIGVLPEGLGFPKQLTATGYLAYFAQLYGRPAAEARHVAARLLEDVGLQNRAESTIGSFSHGMRQRLGIARALVNDPAVVFLDEPTLGLDPRGQRELLTLIQGIARERNKGVMLCSHLLSEIEDVCDDVVIMNAGDVVAKGSVAEVVGQADANLDHRVRIRVPVGSIAVTREVLDAVPGIADAALTEESSGWLAVELAGPANGSGPDDVSRVRNSILDALIRADVPILGFDAGGGRLQDVFLKLTAVAIP